MTQGGSHITNRPAATKLLPPYARALKPFNGAVWIYCGARGWKVRELQKGTTKEAVVLLPDGRQPTDYRWPVKGLSVFVVGLDADIALCGRLVLACLDEEASEVWFIHDALKAGLVHYEGRKAWKHCA